MSDITAHEAEAVYRAYIDGENRRDREQMQRCLAPTLAVAMNGKPQLADRRADEAATDRLLNAYPDYFRDLDHVYVDGATVIAEWTMRGSADESKSIPELEVSGVSIAQISTAATGEPLIVSARLYGDTSGIDRFLADG